MSVVRSVTALTVAGVLLCAGCGDDAKPASQSSPPASPGFVPTPTGPATVGPPATQPVNPSASVATASPAPLDPGKAPPADLAPGLRAVVTKIDQVQVTEPLPGDIAGPAVAFTVEFENTSDRPLNVDAATVTARYRDSEAPEVRSQPARPASGNVEPKSKVSGVYLFRIPPEQRDKVLLRVSVGTSTVAQFAGSVR